MENLEEQLGYSSDELRVMQENLEKIACFLEGMRVGDKFIPPFGQVGIDELWNTCRALGNISDVIRRTKNKDR